MNIKKILMAAAVAAAGIVCAQEMTLVAAREKIVESIANPATMTATISQLSAEMRQLSATSVCFPSLNCCLKMPSS